MARPRLCRRIGRMPGVTYFEPHGGKVKDSDEMVIGFDELESLRLKDALGLKQDEAASMMRISQPTFCRLLASARRKVATSVVDGRVLRVSGGDYIMIPEIEVKEGEIMKIAVASDDGRTISHHFGRALGFVVFDLEGNEVKGREYRENRGKHSGECGSCDHATMIDNIKDCKYVICYGMGRRIYDDLLQEKVTPVVTEEEVVDKALEGFISGTLKDRPEKLHEHH